MNKEKAIRQNQKLRLGSKTFRSIFKSILMLLPVSIIIIVAAEVASLHMMDRLAEDFESRTVSRVLNQVDQDFQQAYMVTTKLKSDETILSYVRKSERNYYSEWEVFDRLRAIISGYNNIEELYLYFPGYEYVISSSNGGKESKNFQADKYACSYDEWLEALNSGIMGHFQTIKGADGEQKNIISTQLSNTGSLNTARAVVVLSNDYLEELLKGLSLRGGEEAFLFPVGEDRSYPGLCDAEGRQLFSHGFCQGLRHHAFRSGGGASCDSVLSGGKKKLSADPVSSQYRKSFGSGAGTERGYG